MGVAEDGVRVEKVSRVRPSVGGAEKKMAFLSSCDLVCRSYPYINRVFFFKCGKGPQEAEAAARVMKEGLAEALASFYPLGGRLGEDQHGRLQVMWEDGDDDDGSGSHGGAEFVEAACELPFSALAQDGFQYRHVFWKLARRTHHLRCDHPHEPMLSVQLTKFKDGDGYSVGVSMSHVVADAQSFYDFVYCWGEVCRGVAMSMPPLHMRDALSVSQLFPKEKLAPSEVPSTVVVNGCKHEEREDVFSTCNLDLQDQGLAVPVSKEPLNGRTVMTELVKDLEHLEFVDKSAALRLDKVNGQKAFRKRAPIMEKQLEEEEYRQPRQDLVQKVFSFSYEKLQQLKQQANGDMICGNANEMLAKLHSEWDGSRHVSLDLQRGFTTFEAFCAHWWQCFIRARRLPAMQTVCLLIPINCRQRFLELPHSYFGNALDGALVKLPAGELCKADLKTIASKIHEAIVAVTEDSFRQYIRAVEGKGNVIPHFDRTGLFHVVDSPKYPVYDVDFGFGTPQAVRAEGFRFGAEVQILAGRHGFGTYDLFCALDAEVMQRLEQDVTFLAC